MKKSVGLSVGLSVLFGTLVSIGCGSDPADVPQVSLHAFSGIVHVDGEPIAGAQVVLHPKESSALGIVTPFGVTDENGRFELSTYRPADGAPEGAYFVTVSRSEVTNPGSSEPDYGPELLPPRYQIAARSGLELHVRPDVADPPVLNLTLADDYSF